MAEAAIQTPETAHEIRIKRASPEDAEKICDIRDRAWLATYPNKELGISEDDIRLLAQGPNGEYLPRRVAYLKEQLANEDGEKATTFLAKIDDKVVGFIDPRVDEKGRRRIGAIYVEPEYQGKGVGSMLMKKVLDWYGKDEEICLEVVSYNDNAINFYMHLGFEPTNTVVEGDPEQPAYLVDLPQIEMVLKARF